MAQKALPKMIADHLRRYLETDGKDGHIWNGLTTLLLTTTGRRSGESRILPLIYGEANGEYIVVASKGGHTHHPSWYLNLAENPTVKIQVGSEKFDAIARTVSGDERASLWDFMAEIFPTYKEYQAKTPREIPVIAIKPAS